MARRPAKSELADMADDVLTKKAKEEGKSLQSEFATHADLAHFFSDMTDRQQAERLDFLFDYYDDDAKGITEGYEWIDGHKSDRIVQRMRVKQPELYQVEHTNRNKWWASRISQMLSDGGIYFVLIGANHTVGPDSLLVTLRRLGIKPEKVE